MIPESKFVSIAQRLLEKTRQKAISWSQDEPDAFQLWISKNTLITLQQCQPKAESDYFLFLIKTAQGKVVGEWRVDDGARHWDLLSELQYELTAQAGGFDDVLREVESFIAQP